MNSRAWNAFQPTVVFRPVQQSQKFVLRSLPIVLKASIAPSTTSSQCLLVGFYLSLNPCVFLDNVFCLTLLTTHQECVPANCAAAVDYVTDLKQVLVPYLEGCAHAEVCGEALAKYAEGFDCPFNVTCTSDRCNWPVCYEKGACQTVKPQPVSLSPQVFV